MLETRSRTPFTRRLITAARQTVLRHFMPEPALEVRGNDHSFFALIDSIVSKPIQENEESIERRLQKRTEELGNSLSGEIRETAYQHVTQALDTGIVFRGVSSPLHAARLLHRLTRALQPNWAVEIGSAFGIGSLAMALGMGVNDSETSRFDGFEFEGWRAEIAAQGLAGLLVGRAFVHAGPVEETFPVVIPDGRKLDFAFVDAMHTYEATLGYHKLVMSVAKPGAAIVYDDINWSRGMMECWHVIRSDPRVSASVLVDKRWGIVRTKV